MSTVQKTHEAVIREYAPLESIVSEGASQDFFYVILEGTVEISQNRKVIRTLQEGDVFGIENYYRKKTYTTSANAITRARIATYRSETIRDIIFEHPQLTEKILASTMRQLEQTTGRAEECIPYELAVPVYEKVYKDGDIIIAEGTRGNEIYRLVEAQHGLRVTLQGCEIATITRPGEFFGEMSPVLHQPRSATVASIGRSRIQVFTIDNIAEDIRQYPDLALSIVNALSIRLQEANRRLAYQLTNNMNAQHKRST
jgi:CRP-like cAMP-binding protein